MATGGNDISSDEIINIKCSFCTEENRTQDAEKYCLECRDYYCLSCATTHTKFPAMRGHKLLDKADFRSRELDGSLPSFPTQRCTQHLSEVVSMFCEDHNEVVCPSCMLLAHRTCTNIHSIQLEVDSLYNRTQFDNLKQKILTEKKTMEDMKKAKESQVEQLKKAFDHEVTAVRAFRKELQTVLDSIEHETIKELKEKFDMTESCLKGEISEINKLLDAMDEAAKQLHKSEGNKSQEFISIKGSEKVAEKAEDMVNEQQKKTEENINFTADHSIKAYLEQIQTLGKYSSNTLPPNINQPPPIVPMISNQSVNLPASSLSIPPPGPVPQMMTSGPHRAPPPRMRVVGHSGAPRFFDNQPMFSRTGHRVSASTGRPNQWGNS